MFKKILLGLLVVAVVVGVTGYVKRKELILFVVANKGLPEVGPNREVKWQKGPDTEEVPADKRPPNIIFILADDLGINDISAFGGGVAGGTMPTPNIDALASQGAMFEQAYAGTGTCAPSRAMLMTGRYPTRTGFEFTPTPGGMGRIVSMFANDGNNPRLMDYDAEAEENSPVYEEQGLPGSEVTIAEVLQKRGYHTAHIGKWHLGEGKEFSAHAQGFDESLLMASGLYLPQDDPEVVNAKIASDPIDKFLWARMQYATAYNPVDYSDLFAPKGYLTDYYTDEAVNVIKANKNRPFFLYLAHWGPHTPLQAAKADYEALAHIKDHRLRVYAAMIRAVDRSVGKVVQTLKEQGLEDNTIIVFSSDNGGAGYIGLPEVNKPYRGWKISLFEGGIKVPYFMKWPAKIKAGTVSKGPVAHIDMMPTLAAAAGADLPTDRVIDGVNLLPFATGEQTGNPHKTLFWQSGYYRVVRHEGWKLQTSERPNKDWLFNLTEDPTEQVNLAGKNPEKLAELKALLAAHKAGARKPLYPPKMFGPTWIDKHGDQPKTLDDEYIYWPN